MRKGAIASLGVTLQRRESEARPEKIDTKEKRQKAGPGPFAFEEKGKGGREKGLAKTSLVDRTQGSRYPRGRMG